MSRYAWLVAAALIAVTVAVLLWADQSYDANDANRAIPRPRPTPLSAGAPHDGGVWRPHLDRAGMHRKGLE